MALVSDAGTPAISDPGAPGAAAQRGRPARDADSGRERRGGRATRPAALPEPPILFYGFLPAKQAARRKAIGRWRRSPAR